MSRHRVSIFKLLLCLVSLAAAQVAVGQAKPELRQVPPRTPVLDTRHLQLKIPLGPQLKKVRAYDRNAYSTGTGDSTVYAGRNFNVDFLLSGLPAGNVKLEIDRSRYPPGSVNQWGTLSAPAAEGAEISRKLEFLVQDAAVPADGVVYLHMLATVIVNGSSTVVPFSREYVILTRMKRVLWTDTASRAAHASFRLLSSGPGSTCEGESWTPAGTYPVGMTTRGSKLVFRIRSGPLGTACTWKGTEQPSYVPYPWRIIALNWKATASDQCKKPEVESSRPQAPAGSLRTDWIGVGNGRQVIADLRLPDNTLPVMLVGLHCNNTVFNDHFVETVWESIEMEGPVDQSFNSFHWY